MTIKIHTDVLQGSDEWFALRTGILTASEMKMCITPTLKIADNDETRSHMYELLAQRITGCVEPHFMSDDMLRGHEEEVLARDKYAEVNGVEVDEVGFITNDKWGFTIGCSPDGLVGSEGMIECKSRRQKYQLETILSRGMPLNKKINCSLQIQAALMVTERTYCDFVSYHGGMPMWTFRVYNDLAIQEAIIRAAGEFYKRMDEMHADYLRLIADPLLRLTPTEKTERQEIFV